MIAEFELQNEIYHIVFLCMYAAISKNIARELLTVYL